PGTGSDPGLDPASDSGAWRLSTERLEAAREGLRPDLEALRNGLEAGPSARERTNRKLGERLEQVLQHKVAPSGLMVISRAMRGIESCPLCGHGVNMGSFELRRLDEQRAFSHPYMAVHSLVTHGMSDYDSGLNGTGSVDVNTLKMWIGA